MYIKKLVYLIGLIFLISEAFAQTETGRIRMDSTSIYMFHNTIDSADFPIFVPYDSTLSGIEKSNPSWRNAAYADLGNIGQAQHDMLFSYQRTSGFYYKNIPYHSFMRNAKNPVYFRSLLPYSEVYYRLGAKKEQVVGIDFSSNLYKGLTLGILFDLTFAPGSYVNQKASTNDLSVSLRYFTPNYRYGVIGAFSHYKVNAYENGGIVDDLASQTELRPEAIPVNLTTGGTTVRDYGFEVTQYFHITKPPKPQKPQDSTKMNLKEDIPDTLAVAYQYMDSVRHVFDSIGKSDEIVHERRKFNWGRLSLRSKMADLSWLYDNSAISKDYFPNYYNDSTKTHDSVRYFKFENTFSYSNANLNPRSQSNQFRYYLYLTHQYIQIKSIPQNDAYNTLAPPNNSEYSYNQLIPKLQIFTRLFRTFDLRASGDYVLTGYNKDDFSLSGSIGNLFGKGKNQTEFRVGLMAALQMPDWFYGYYSGNHYRWENDFDKINYYVFSASLSNRWFTLSGDYSLLSNYVYLNQDALPESAENTQNVMKISLKSKINVGKHWVFDNLLAYQNSFNSDVIQLPDFTYNGNIYFRMSLAKGALIIMPGISLFYNTSYYADAYTPALNAFYLQRDQSIGNYLYADFFVDINIKRARIFVKYRHFDNILLQNTGMGYNYYMVPNYPQMNGGVYAGVSWRFIN